ncbi:predicted protein, partial [Arabidopsis lyrata subsp. lyrata]
PPRTNHKSQNDSVNCIHKRSPSDQSHHHRSWRKLRRRDPKREDPSHRELAEVPKPQEERRRLKKHGDAPPISQIWRMVPPLGAAPLLQSPHQSHNLKQRETRRTSFAPCVATRRFTTNKRRRASGIWTPPKLQRGGGEDNREEGERERSPLRPPVRSTMTGEAEIEI